MILASGLLAMEILVGHLLHQRKYLADLRESGHKHTVKNSETVQSTAADYVISWKCLVRVNGIKAPYTLSAGKVLHVPAQRKHKK